MESVIQKCAKLVMKSGKRYMRTEWNCPLKKKLERSKKETYKSFSILEAITIKQIEMKEKIKNEYLWRIR